MIGPRGSAHNDFVTDAVMAKAYGANPSVEDMARSVPNEGRVNGRSVMGVLEIDQIGRPGYVDYPDTLMNFGAGY